MGCKTALVATFMLMSVALARQEAEEPNGDRRPTPLQSREIHLPSHY
jgi:hypothetical protein